MKLLLLFALFAFSPLTWGRTPSRVQIAAAPMNRVVRPDTPANQRLLKAIEAGDLPGVQAALQSGASADAEAGWEGQPETTPVALFAAVSPFMGRQHSPAIFRLLIQNLSASSAADPKNSFALLSAAVELEDLASVRRLVSEGADVNARAPRQFDILHQSIDQDVSQKTLSPITAFLLDHGAQVNAQTYDTTTPLMAAAWADKMDVLRALLAHGADPALRDKQGQTALQWAALRGWDDAISLLRDRSPMDIFETAQFGDVPRLKAHLDAGEDPNMPGARGTTPLMEAMKSGSLPAARLLLDRGANVNQKRTDGATALHLAALYGDAPLAGLLLDRGANINAVSGKPQRPVTPLVYAVTRANADVVALILKRGPDLSHGQGEAALERATREVGNGLVRPPVGLPKNRVRYGEAVYEARLRVIDLLLGAGVDLRSKNSHCLYLAASSGQASLVELFLNKGADANGRGATGPFGSQEDGETALMGAVQAWAFAYSDEEDVKNGSMTGPTLADIHQNEQLARQSVMLLLAHGANVNLPDARGTTPLMLCVTYQLLTLAALLLEHGARIDAVNPAGQTALMQAASVGDHALTALLLVHHASVNRRDNLGRTPLMLAIDDGPTAAFQASRADEDEGRPAPISTPSSPMLMQDEVPNPDDHPKTVRLLLKHGASVNAVAANGVTALSLARKQHFSQVITLLKEAGARR